MSVKDELAKVTESAQKSGVIQKVQTGLMVTGGIVLGAGATYLIMKHVNVPAVASAAAEKAPEVVEAVAETAEAVL